MKVLITGAGGQLGSELQKTAPSGISVVALTSRECDVGDEAVVSATLRRESPDVIINSAAYTAVDKAESDLSAAVRVNTLGPAHLASHGNRLLHVSTDFVFDGASGRPLRPNDPTGPLSVYGSTKLAGEAHVTALGTRGLVMRTSWVYSTYGSNFVKTMLKNMATKSELRVVSDQFGAPTWARGLAEVLWRCVEMPALNGIHHWRDAGSASWYDFALAIGEEASGIGLLSGEIPILPIASDEYPTPATRPRFSLLDCSDTWKALGVIPPHWRKQLRMMLQEVKERGFRPSVKTS
jgi:dTDP-4-dehydrorhamnose reductase